MVSQSRILLHLVVVALCLTLPGACARMHRAGPSTESPTAAILEYKHTEGIGERFGYVGSSTVGLGEKPNETLAAEPAYASSKPLYGELEIGSGEDNRYAFALDASKGGDSGYDTFYIDGNNNENLNDDPKSVMRAERQGSTPPYPSVELAVVYGQETYPYHVSPRTCGSSTNHVHMTPAAYCEGEIRVGKKAYRVALLDDTANAVFNDSYVPTGRESSGNVYVRGDALVIDLDEDGEFEKSYYDMPEVHHVGKYLCLSGEYYEMAVAPHGRSIQLSPANTDWGYLTTTHKQLSAELINESGPLKLHGGKRKLKVPTGEYQLAQCSFQAKDDAGHSWRIVGLGQWDQPRMEVIAKKKTKLALGPPLVAEVQTDKTSAREFRFSLKVAGQGGELYSPGRFERVGQEESLPAPKFRVLTKDGKQVAEYQFRYG